MSERDANGQGENLPQTAERMLADRYSLGRFIGQGGMATVYKGYDNKLKRPVAIKIMKVSLAGDENFRERFRQEAEAASRMAHPTIVKIFDAGEELIRTGDGPKLLPFIVMEYVEGANLQSLPKEGAFSQKEACRIVEAVLTALEYSHRAGIIHRDIKPANIMLTKDGRVKVMDFGIARAVSNTSSTLQQTTAILGTASYFSPEQAKGDQVDARTDLYSTAIVLYELLAGKPPFRGTSAVAVAYQHVSERPKPPSETNPEIPESLDRVVLHGLAKDRARRFQTAAEFREALKLAARGQTASFIEQDDVNTLFSLGENISDTELALKQLAEAGPVRTQSRPPVMWTWAAILGIAGVVVALVLWVMMLVPQSVQPSISRTVPSVAGLTEERAVKKLRELELEVTVTNRHDKDVAAEHAIGTNPEANIILSKGEAVELIISLGPEKAEVPQIDRAFKDEYVQRLNDLGLVVSTVNKVDDPSEPAGRILSVDPAPGTKLASGEQVALTVSSGEIEVPDVLGHPLDAARTMLEATGIQVKLTPLTSQSSGCSVQNGYPIIKQSLAGKTKQGSQVEAFYCAG